MAAAYWCILIAGMMPLMTVAIAKAGGNVDNKAPRDAVLTGYRRRAHAAHSNGYEAFPFFAAAVITALMQNASLAYVNKLAIAFIIVRVVYVGFYLANIDLLRSLSWMIGLALTVAIFLAPLTSHG